MAVYVHPTAIVDVDAVLEDEVHIGPFCVVGPHVSIGAGTQLKSHVSVQGHVRIGSNNIFFPFCLIGAEPQDKGYKDAPTWVEIGDNNTFREGVTIHRATEKEDGVTRVGSHNYLMGYCHIAHDVKFGSYITMANNTVLGGHVHVDDYAALSGMIAVHHFTSISSYAFIGGMSRITTDVPPYMLVEGNPSVVRCVNLVGLKRRGLTALEIKSLTEAHRLIYRVKMNATQAKEILASHDHLTQPAIKLFEFLDEQRLGRFGRARERFRAA